MTFTDMGTGGEEQTWKKDGNEVSEAHLYGMWCQEERFSVKL